MTVQRRMALYTFEALKSLVSGKTRPPESKCSFEVKTGTLCRKPCDGPTCAKHTQPKPCGHMFGDGTACAASTKIGDYCAKHIRRDRCQAIKKNGDACGVACNGQWCPRHSPDRRESQYDGVIPGWWPSGAEYIPRFITDAIMDCANAYKTAFANMRAGNISSFSMRYRTKKMRVQSFYVEKSCFGACNSFLKKMLGDVRVAPIRKGRQSGHH